LQDEQGWSNNFSVESRWYSINAKLGGEKYNPICPLCVALQQVGAAGLKGQVSVAPPE
jgi:hypothetical protein